MQSKYTSSVGHSLSLLCLEWEVPRELLPHRSKLIPPPVLRTERFGENKLTSIKRRRMIYSHHQREGQSVFFEGFPEGEARGKSRGSRGAKPTAEENLEGGGDGFPNTSRVLVEYGHSLIITREGLIDSFMLCSTALMSPSCGSFLTKAGMLAIL